WGPTAWTGLNVSEPAKERLKLIVDQAGARLMLIRRPGSQPSAATGSRCWCIVDQDAEPSVRWGSAASDEELIEAALTLGSASTEGEGGGGSPGEPQIILVCTHGL